ncbi:3374_t:CDS:2 [Paraglomus brasilianum]|uniref:5-demethoxyubiquinone hydroxylase, mitochondrial n=1 Tax=Paraglomus brasilianum TaxID=144538 RepID=A0A9N9CKZ7_9GLOM|nr:3374_t:CDS:2 [Paraglomus brasilianum]
MSLRRSDATTADLKDSTIDTIESKASSKKRPLTYQERKLIESMIRVDHAGELGANYIYKGQMAVLGKDKEVGHVIQEMWDQEKVHLRTFDEIIPRYRVRPTLLRPLWETAGFMLGAGTALMGKEAAMACTEAVETVIGEHYNDQLRELINIDNEETTELREVIKKFRDEELQHLETSVDYDAQKAPLYGPLSAMIHAGCKAAIWITTRL